MSTFRGKFLAASLIMTLALGVALDAEAKRLGGSRSVGKQSSQVTQQRQQAPQTPPAQQGAPAQQAAPATAGAAAGGAAAAAPKRNWGGMLGGLAAGLGLGYLLSHFGLGEAMAGFLGNLIIIALIAFAAIWLIRKFRGGGAQRREPAFAGMGNGAAGGNREPAFGQPKVAQPEVRQSEPTFRQAEQPAAGAAGAVAGVAAGSAPQQAWGVPADFDTENFLRNAKVHYVRLQAAWDAGNLDDIREFTTPEMFAEIRMDLSERGAEVNKTDVVTLEAQLLGIESTPTQHVASVRFSGMIRERVGEAAQPFAEVWNLAKPVNGGGWLLAGIQQDA
ncbi:MULTISPECIES: Tim44 domain-containing protein [Cupriavidus]|uniref:Tim44 domain-containing protein n=1 Tax=Cupriavidus pauculus TaxID=82633 RepID=A0A5P2H4H9_9BURK|nr:Tim44-like domain-containing protein [Cupriavidus pauculus]QET02806.1 Tim44 domain-containing protein [Cupriavidus pauculus]